MMMMMMMKPVYQTSFSQQRSAAAPRLPGDCRYCSHPGSAQRLPCQTEEQETVCSLCFSLMPAACEQQRVIQDDGVLASAAAE